MAEMSGPPQVLPEEPAAVTPHGGFCGGESQQWLSYPTNLHVRLCVQRRLACSAGERPAGARVRSPVVWIAGWREAAVVDVAVRGEPIVHVSAGIRLRGAAFGQPLMKRLISSKKRLEAGSCSRNKWFRPGKGMKRAPGMPAANWRPASNGTIWSSRTCMTSVGAFTLERRSMISKLLTTSK